MLIHVSDRGPECTLYPINKREDLECFYRSVWCDTFIPILQADFIGTMAMEWLPKRQWSNLEEYGWNLTQPNSNKTQ